MFLQLRLEIVDLWGLGHGDEFVLPTFLRFAYPRVEVQAFVLTEIDFSSRLRRFRFGRILGVGGRAEMRADSGGQCAEQDDGGDQFRSRQIHTGGSTGEIQNRWCYDGLRRAKNGQRLGDQHARDGCPARRRPEDGGPGRDGRRQASTGQPVEKPLPGLRQ